ncbi:MAG: hypothetical protein K6E98_09270 [Lachnospiraceae bacterium]|nr:hypothetical protein [Lachnospiraceae bacterium]
MKQIKDISKWVGAFAAAFILVNVTLIPYYHYTPGIPLEVNATNEIYYPESRFITAAEGWSTGRFDINGYLNDEESYNRDEYVLVMGSSHTMGKEVPNGYNFCEILDKQYDIPVYNIAMDGHFLNDNISGFSAALSQFDKAHKVVIEVSQDGLKVLTADMLKQALHQKEYDVNRTGPNIVAGMSTVDRLKAELQTWFPYRILIKQKINALRASDKGEEEFSKEEFYDSLSEALGFIRSKYDKPIIILYHPNLEIDKNGEAYVSPNYKKQILEKACVENNILFEDMTDLFIEEYNSENKLPHGFMNTAPGSGHLNKTGHKLIAQKLNSVLKTYNNFEEEEYNDKF